MSDALTVVYQDLSADEKRVIFNDNRVARLRHGCAITEMREIDRIASELQDTCHSQAKRIAEQDALLRQALDALNHVNVQDRLKIIAALRARVHH